MLAEAALAPAAVTIPLSRRLRVVIDPRLALRALGPFIVSRLSAECVVWLPSELRQILHGSHAYRAEPDKLVPRVHGVARRGHDRTREAEAEDIRESLEQWDAALARGAGVRAYHLGERADDALLPANVDPGVHQRFEALARGLDRLMTRSGYDLPRGIAISSCFRDAVALAAALSRDSCFILTALESDGRIAPALCNYLDAWKVNVADVTANAGMDSALLRGTLSHAGLTPVEWSGISFAAVHVVPRTLAPRLPCGAALEDAAAVRLWERTRIFWHRL
jgi:hypothetical protein